MELRNKGLKIAKKRIEEKYFLEYQKLQETFGDKWEIYEYQSERLHTYILYIYGKEVPFISLKFDLLPLVKGIGFGLSLDINKIEQKQKENEQWDKLGDICSDILNRLAIEDGF